MKLKPIKVSMLNQYIKKYLMSNSILNNLRVEGEISNIRMSKTGYTYFTLCDESACISCVCFFEDPISKNGDKIIVEGELSVYEIKGTYQLIVRNIERVGMGKILQDLNSLIEQLKAQGMFENKKELPVYPSNIGIITSKTGAAIKDIIKTFESVKADFNIIIYNTLVQGDKSNDIIHGIKYFNEINTDVILISRGGGSFEDLNIFNDVSIATEVYKSKIPVVTGIGHETDRTLTDYVADVYCHTPTAAAERIIMGYRDIEKKLENLLYNLKYYTNNYIRMKTSELKTSKYILKTYLPLERIYKLQNELDSYKNIISNSSNQKLNDLKAQLQLLNEKLNNNNYKKQLEKGFTMVTNDEGTIIKDKEQVKDNDILKIIFKDFIIKAKILNIEEDSNGI